LAAVERQDGRTIMSKVRVGLLCGYFDPKQDGVADYTRRLADQLRRAGMEPVVVTTYTCARVAGEGTVGVTDRWGLQGVTAAARAVRQLDLDLVHVQFAPSVFGSSRAVGFLPLLLRSRVPLIVTLHEYGVWPDRGRFHRVRSAVWSAVERRGFADRETLVLVARAARLLVPSSENLHVLRTRSPSRAPAALEVPIGLNIEVSTDDRARARADLRRELGTTPDAPVVVFFGFLHPKKGLDLLIRAVAALQATRPGTQLLLIGGAESHSVPRSEAERLHVRLEQVALTSGIPDHVHFTGYLPDAAVSRLLRAADAAAFPFDAGVTRKSSSLLAALACGVPVIATAPPGELSAPIEAGGILRVPPRDVVALADALARVLGDDALAGRLIAAGRTVAAHQSWEAICAAHAAVYARALASTEGAGSWTPVATQTRVESATATEGDVDVRS
jgi:glycosyltransferase involved in cell wall biosynthesis